MTEAEYRAWLDEARREMQAEREVQEAQREVVFAAAELSKARLRLACLLEQVAA
jgi:hypothetical protein